MVIQSDIEYLDSKGLVTKAQSICLTNPELDVILWSEKDISVCFSFVVQNIFIDFDSQNSA